MNDQERQALFSELLTRSQSQVYGYIFGVVRNWQDADDLYQSVCLILWRKFELFQPGSNFLAWARKTTTIELSKFLRERKSPASINEELLDEIADPFLVEDSGDADSYLAALRHCKAKLSGADEELLNLHYSEALGSREIAGRLQRPQSSVCHSLNRIRGWLLNCVRMELAVQERQNAHE